MANESSCGGRPLEDLVVAAAAYFWVLALPHLPRDLQHHQQHPQPQRQKIALRLPAGCTGDCFPEFDDVGIIVIPMPLSSLELQQECHGDGTLSKEFERLVARIMHEEGIDYDGCEARLMVCMCSLCVDRESIFEDCRDSEDGGDGADGEDGEDGGDGADGEDGED